MQRVAGRVKQNMAKQRSKLQKPRIGCMFTPRMEDVYCKYGGNEDLNFLALSKMARTQGSCVGATCVGASAFGVTQRGLRHAGARLSQRKCSNFEVDTKIARRGSCNTKASHDTHKRQKRTQISSSPGRCRSLGSIMQTNEVTGPYL